MKQRHYSHPRTVCTNARTAVSPSLLFRATDHWPLPSGAKADDTAPVICARSGANRVGQRQILPQTERQTQTRVGT